MSLRALLGRSGRLSSSFSLLRGLALTVLLGIAGQAAAVDLLISNLVDNPDPAIRGGKIVYTATMTNNQVDTAHNVTLSFALDAQMNFVSVNDASCAYVAATNKVDCLYPVIKGDTTGPGTADVKVVAVTVTTKATAGATVSLSATVGSTDTDTNPGNETKSELTTLDNGADLALALSASPSSVPAAGSFDYTVNVTNNGPNSAGFTIAVLTLNPYLSYQSATGSGWACGASGQVVTCSRNQSGVGVQPAITVRAKVTGAQTGNLSSTGNVSATGAATDYDTTNNTASATVNVTTGTDLAITKTASSATPTGGAPMTFTLNPVNNGPFAAAYARVTDTLPAGFTAISAASAGWTCGVAGQTVSCTANQASLPVGNASPITVTATAPTVLTATSYTNTARIATDTVDSVAGNDAGSVTVNVLPDGVDLSIAKSKTPTPVAQGGQMTSTIAVKNNGPRNAAAGEVRVLDTLPAGETWAGGYSGAGWTCAAAGQNISCTYGSALAVGATTGNLVLTTTATASGTLANTACAQYVPASGSLVDPLPSNDCAGATAASTPSAASIDLAITKLVNPDPLAFNADTLVFSIAVTNNANAPADGISLRDDLANFVTTGTQVTAVQAAGTTAATFTCSGNPVVSCVQQAGASLLKNEVANFTITLKRPLKDSGAGKTTNTATVTSSSQGDTNLLNNTASIDVAIQPLADVAVTSQPTPATAQAGTSSVFTYTVKNNGASNAAGVRLVAQLTPSAGTVTWVSQQTGKGTCSWTNATLTLDCAIGTLVPGEAQSVTLNVRPDYMPAAPANRTVTSNAGVTTTTNETNLADNNHVSTLNVTQASVDLLVNNSDNVDPLGFVPASAGPTFPDNVVTYANTINNHGPSVASGVTLTYQMTPPNGKQMRFLGDKLAPTGQAYSNYCDHLGDAVAGPATLTITCALPTSGAAGAPPLAVNASSVLYLDFRVETTPSSTGDTYNSTITVGSAEPESLTINNTVTQTTSVRMRTDLQLAKSARAIVNGSDSGVSTVQLRQPFYWVLTLTNAGPGDSQVTAITDTLPAGVALYQAPAGAPAAYQSAPYNSGTVAWTNNNGTPQNSTCSVSGSSVSCSLGLLESGKVAIVRIPVVATAGTSVTNCASATTSEVDPNSANNTNVCSAVTVQAASIGGTVYLDANNDGAKASGEAGIAGATVKLTGLDAYGNAVSLTAAATGSNGTFSFTNLTGGTYQLDETQPSNTLDGKDAAGSAGGTVAGTGAGSDSIAAITLAPGAAATGYLFGELPPAQVGGFVFVDKNANAKLDAGETTGVSGVVLALTGTDDTGAAVNLTATSGPNGAYSFTNLRPGTYTVTEPAVPGLTHTGMTAGSLGGLDGATSIAAGTPVTGAGKLAIGGIVLGAGASATGYNFGESGQGLSGSVYVDLNGNGQRDAGEPGIEGVSVTLSGKTANNVNVCVQIDPNPCTVTTGADGAYSFSGVPASDAAGYTIAEQSQATAPLSNYADGAEHAGTLGGSTAVNDRIGGIVQGVGQFGAGYDFGERGAAIAARVYHDRNDNGALDAGEPGVAGVTVKLSGTTADGRDVCTVIAGCTATTAADGTVAFSGLPASNGAGYTLTETQPADYAERANTAGSAGGTAATGAGTSTISGIVIAAGGNATGYLFGEKTTTVAGHVYADANNDGVRGAGEAGIAGVTVKLSGTTASGADVCTLAACTAVTAADGSYAFANVPNAGAAGYTIAEQTQNTAPLASWLDGKLTAGTNCGACGKTATGMSPNAFSALVVDASKNYADYDFAELAPGSLAGRVYKDGNDNGNFDSGEALAGITVTLSGTDDLGQAVNRTAVTGIDGSYTFGTLRAGTYLLTESQPASFADYPGATGTAVGKVGGVPSGTALQNQVTAVNLGVGGAGTGYDFREKTASLSGMVFADYNDNGLLDAGDPPVNGVTLRLTGTDADGGAVDLTTTTAAGGAYAFTGLKSGTYAIVETQPAGYADGRETAGSAGGAVNNAAFDFDPAHNTIGAIQLGAGTAATGYNFAERLLGSIGGIVYVDRNGNGQQDAGEPGIGGVVVKLQGRDLTGAVVQLSTVTTLAGAFQFSDVMPSDASGYALTEEQPPSYLDGITAVPGGMPGTVSAAAKPVRGGGADTIAAVVLGGGQNLAGYRFGEKETSMVTGTVYVDRNGNGVQDADEPGLPGVPVSLQGKDTNGAAVQMQAVSDATGGFSFGNLVPSDPAGYTLSEIQPAGYLDGATTIAAGNPGKTAGKPAAAGAADSVSGIVVPNGAVLQNYRFGERPLAALSGAVYLDRNGNGQQDADETGLAGVNLTLQGKDANGTTVQLKAATDAGGVFAFANVPPSDAAGYTLAETQPAGYADGATTIGAGNPGKAAGAKPVAAGADDAVSSIVVPSGAGLKDYRFGEQPGAQVAGRVFVDLDRNGAFSQGDKGLAGVTVTLAGKTAGGLAVSRSAVTGADGSWLFDRLEAPDAAGYTVTEVQPDAYDDGATLLAAGNPGKAAAKKPLVTGGLDTIAGIVFDNGVKLAGYEFGELQPRHGATVSGRVFADPNNDGVAQADEAGIPGVAIQLSGLDNTGAPVAASTTTGPDGRYQFAGLAPSNAAGYRIAEIQPTAYTDGKTVPATGLPGKAASSKPVLVGNFDAFTGIVVADKDLPGYDFAEIPVPTLKPPFVNGYVWLDRAHDRVRPQDGSQQGLGGWTVQLRQNGKVICTVQTDANGFYQFDNLHCPGYEFTGLPTGSGFSIAFSKDGNRLPAVATSGDNRGQAAPTGGLIDNITIKPGDAIVEQNLPLDPAGIVYDSQTRKPVAGAVVTIGGPAGFDVDRHLVGGSAARAQTVGADGMYQFLLQNDFPSGTYTITVTAPAGYLPGPSTAIPPCAGTAVVRLVPTPALVQASDGPPAASVPLHNAAACAGIVAGGAPTTQYYGNFVITNGGSAPILNNNIPLDPVPVDGLVLSKTTPLVNVARGDLVPYTIVATNTRKQPVAATVQDILPPGFQYKPGTARLNGAAVAAQLAGRTLSFAPRTFSAGEKAAYTLALVVGGGVAEGEYVNQAVAIGTATGKPASNVATATVRIVPDPTFDCPDVIGKVFDDANRNGYQDEGERGIPGVRLATPRGLLVTTDADGRWHIPCADLPNADRGSNFVAKLDDRTLPSGYRVTTENPGSVRLTRGKVARLNFGAAIHRVVRVELSGAAFEAGGTALLPQWNEQIDKMLMMRELDAKPSVVRIAYRREAGEDAALATRRAQAVADAIRERWRGKGGRYPLAVEMEDAQ